MEHARDPTHGHAHADGHAGESPWEPPSSGASEATRRRLLVVALFAGVIMVAEAAAGFVANSLVLLSDALHMSTDVVAVLLAYAAARIAVRPPDLQRSYGYHRAEVLAAFLNALALWGLSAYLVYEAWRRATAPPPIDGPLIALVGAFALGANLLLASLLHRARSASVNVRGAYVHVLSDAVGSGAAIVTGVGVAAYGAAWLDPVATFLIAALVLVWTWRLTRQTLHVLLEGAPASLPAERVREAIAGVPGVLGVHDLHVWSLTTGVDSLSAHVQVLDPAQGPDVVRAIRQQLAQRYPVAHVTIEVEGRDSDCVGCN